MGLFGGVYTGKDGKPYNTQEEADRSYYSSSSFGGVVTNPHTGKVYNSAQEMYDDQKRQQESRNSGWFPWW